MSFQYIEDDKKAMEHVYKLMKKGGWGVMQVPIDTSRKVTYEDNSITDPKERVKAFGLKEHVRYYSYDYADKLRTAGLAFWWMITQQHLQTRKFINMDSGKEMLFIIVQNEKKYKENDFTGHFFL